MLHFLKPPVVSVFFPFTTHSSVMQRVVAERYRISVMTHGFSVTHSPDILLPCCSCGTAATHRAPKLLHTSSHEVPPWVRCERCVCVCVALCVCGKGLSVPFCLSDPLHFYQDKQLLENANPSPLHHSDTHKHTFPEMFGSKGHRWSPVYYLTDSGVVMTEPSCTILRNSIN